MLQRTTGWVIEVSLRTGARAQPVIKDHHGDLGPPSVAAIIIVDVAVSLEVRGQSARRVTGAGVGAVVTHLFDQSVPISSTRATRVSDLNSGIRKRVDTYTYGIIRVCVRACVRVCVCVCVTGQVPILLGRSEGPGRQARSHTSTELPDKGQGHPANLRQCQRKRRL
eukprot:COSAG05_NODE_2795_length_2629_cov_3.130435_2_plen_167_part_00